jgi:streptogramin lyase
VISECDLAQGSVPTDLVTGSDGNLWFTENASNRIARLNLVRP